MILTLTTHPGTAFMASRARSLAIRRFSSQVPSEAATVELDSVPATFAQCISSAQSAAKAAIDDGFRLMEIEFPPLQADMLESPECSAYDVSKANVRLAVDFAKSFVADGKQVAIMMPDKAEAVRAAEQQGTDNPYPNVTIHSLIKGFESANTIDGLVMSLFGKQNKQPIETVEDADMYILLVFSAQELPQLEDLALEEPSKPIVFFNLKLDTLRGDLGLPAFPPKDLQYRFLSQILPVYYLRTRAYSKSVATPPYLINYRGALFRSYPSGWQSLLDVGRGRYKRVQLSPSRPGLGEFKVQLSEALQIGDEGKVQSFFRQGYKTSTWWEDDVDKELSKVWRS